MPVRSLNSPVFKWPDRETVWAGVKAWVDRLSQERAELIRAGIFGSYARGDWGVSSDVDIILILRESRAPFWQRALEWDASGLPVPAEVLVYTEKEGGKWPSGGTGSIGLSKVKPSGCSSAEGY